MLISFRRFIGLFALLPMLAGCEEQPPAAPMDELVTLSSEQAGKMADSLNASVTAQLSDGLQLSLWASDSLLEDPVALFMDVQGRAYVTSTDRGTNSEFDIRGHRDWMTRSISWTSIEDRRNFLHQELSVDSPDQNLWFPDLNRDSVHNWHDLQVEQERVIRIVDTDGDGLADQSNAFVRGFNTEISDVAGAFTEYNGEYFLGVAPDLWRLRDNNHDGTVDEMTSIVHGYQVHIGFGGHGMSGLKVGPDGKLYWGIGDIGFNITDQTGKQWLYPNQGAIFRANPDGSDFEVFAAGLRNTHEFDFDAYGNLISVDNDGDYPGEMERLVYIVHGSDAGWRANWQYGKYTDPKNNRYNVWMDEEMFKPRQEGQAAHIIPPIKNYHSGPTGLKYQPGTAVGGRWPNHFFVVEFPGAPSRAKIHAFELEPDGAGFELKQEEVIARGVLATGLDIGADGALYFSDWITGWSPKGYGRIWKLDDETSANSSMRQEVKSLLQSDWTDKDDSELLTFLAHQDRRIRQQAQFELAKRGEDSGELFLETIRESTDQMARIHAIWGYAQLIRQGEADAETLLSFLSDQDPEVRAQSTRMLGDVRYKAGEQLIPLLGDESSRVRFFAAEAIARIAYEPAIPALIQMLEDNDDRDVYLRHAGAFALSSIGKAEPLMGLVNHQQVAVRIAAVVALRRMQHPAVGDFLNDSEEWVVTEAARAIHDDWSIAKAMPALAAYLEQDNGFRNEPLVRRALSANSRLGRPEDLQRLVRFAVNRENDPEMRAEAIRIMACWDRPSETDRVDGRYRGQFQRDAETASLAMSSHIDDLIISRDTQIVQATLELIGGLRMNEFASVVLARLLRDSRPEVREQAVVTMARLETDQLTTAIGAGLEDRNPDVRGAALAVVPDLVLPAEEIVQLLDIVIRQGSLGDQQEAIAALKDLPADATQPVVESLLQSWEKGRLRSELQLELGEAIESQENEALSARLTALRDATDDPLEQYADALTGGDPRAGRNVVLYNSAAQCVRCHAIGNRDGAEVGPNLNGVGQRLTRESLLLALVAPSAELASGFGTAVVTLKNGETTSGILLEETSSEIRLQTDRAEPVRFPRANIEKLLMAPSAMPDMTNILSRRQIRDVVAYLESLK